MAHTTDLRAATDTVRLTGVRRGTRDPKRLASFYAWLLGIDATQTPAGWAVPCANGDLEFVEGGDDVAVEFAGVGGAGTTTTDPDGVPILAASTSAAAAAASDALAALDHVSLMCADVSAATQFYRRLGLVVTWSARGEEVQHGVQESPIDGADWVHVSGADGYLALSQADGSEYGTHTDGAGPPRFVHLGLAVADLAAITARLDAADVAYLPAPSSDIGERLYLNDPDGDPHLGRNIELVEYAPGVSRSGRLS